MTEPFFEYQENKQKTTKELLELYDKEEIKASDFLYDMGNYFKVTIHLKNTKYKIKIERKTKKEKRELEKAFEFLTNCYIYEKRYKIKNKMIERNTQINFLLDEIKENDYELEKNNPSKCCLLM